ncbi:MAG: hypothetical protein WBD37_15755, partial [Anderseniella sp.]
SYYKKTGKELQDAGLGKISSPLRNTLYTLSIYAKWRLNGKFSILLGRSDSAHLRAYLADHPELIR